MLRTEIAELENFLVAEPDSPYAPDLRRQLGQYYRSIGRYSLALARWTEAFESCADATEGVAVEIANESLAQCAKMLASLGRVEELQDLKDRYLKRRLGGGFWAMQFRGAMESLAMMRRHPEISFRCGSFAVAEVAQVLKGGWVSGIMGAESPETGFSARQLEELAQSAGVPLRAALREAGDQLVVPSVIHWGDDHYAALTQLSEERVEVVDPTFLMRTWLAVGDVSAEASGVFLIPEDRLPRGWRWLDPAEATQVFGKGFPTINNPGNDGGGGGGGGCGEETGDQGESPTECCGGGGPGGGGPGPNGPSPGPSGPGGPGPTGDEFAEEDCSSCDGLAMPVWRVSEPWLNLWIYDRPYVYKPKQGPAVRLEIMYKSRQASYASGYSRFSRESDTLWRSPWFARVGVSPVYPTDQLVLLGADGREVNFWISEVHSGGGYPLGFLQDAGWLGKPVPVQLSQLIVSGTPVGYEALRPNGWREQYTNQLPDQSYVLSALVDPHGQTIRFQKTSVFINDVYGIPREYVRLDRVIAPDGLETRLYYDNSSFPQTVTRVVGPNGETTTLTYDDNQSFGTLATITDVAGIVSRINYDGWGVPSSLVTPYGTTDFQVEDNTGGTGHDYSSQIDRAVTVTEPGGLQQVYALINIDGTGAVPNTPPPVPTAGSGETGWIGTLDTSLPNHRNTFYWGRAASQYLTNGLSSLTAPEFKYARIRHWLSYGDNGTTSSFVGNILSWQRLGSPDGVVDGPAVWYDYAGKPTGGGGGVLTQFPGTNNLPSVVAWVMPDNSTRYRFTDWNARQRPLQRVDRWKEGSSTLYRTHTYTYAANDEDLLVYKGPGGVFQAGYAYDANRRMIRMTNAVNDEVTKYAYDSLGRLQGILTPSGNLTSNVFSGDGLTRTTVRFDNGTAYSTNSRSRTLGVSYGRMGLNGTTITQRTTWVVETNPYGLSVTSIYDSLGRLWERREPNLTRRYHYELYPSQSYPSSTGGKRIVDLTAVENVINGTLYNTTTYTYDALRRRAFVGEPSGTLTAYQYCDCGKVSQVTRGHGLALAETTSYQHDLLGRVVSITHPGGAVVTHGYDTRGRRTSTTDALGTQTFVYDNLNRLRETWNAFGRTEGRLYDDFDRVTSRTDSGNVTTTTSYDAAHRLTSRSLTGGGTETWSYSVNVAGPTSYTDLLSQVTQYTYHSAGWKTNEAILGVMTNRFRFNGAGDLEKLWDGNQSLATSGQAMNGTTWQYDTFGRVRHKVYANNLTNLTYSYDALGRLTNRWIMTNTSTGAGADTEYRYDVNGNLTLVNYPTGTTDVSFQYDALNRVTTMVDATGTTTYTYSNGLLQSENGPWNGDTVSYAYNTARQRNELVILQPTGNAWTNTYAWDAARRLSGVTSPAGAHTYLYDTPGSRVRSITLPGGLYLTNDFDSLSRLANTEFRNSAHAILNRHGYAYNAGHQRTTLSRTNSTATTWNGYSTASYDGAGEVREVKAYNSSGVSVPSENFFYGYDFGWNMLKRTNNASITTYTPNVLNQAAGSYDARGNRISGTDSYTYDAENQLIQIEQASSWKLEFVYDGRQRLRIIRDFEYSGGSYTQRGETRLVYDGLVPIQERTSSSNPTVTYTRGTDLSGTFEGAGGIGGLVARSTHAGGTPFQPNSHAFYHADGNGNVTYLTRSDGSAVGVYKYDPFGRTLATSGTLASANRMRFSSKPWVQSSSGSSGYYAYGYRFYDPTSQRWLNRDPIVSKNWSQRLGASFPLYPFVHNRPLGYADPLGLFEFPWPGNGSVVNCGDFDIQVLIDGRYYTLHPGESTADNIIYSVDVDGYWNNSRFRPVGAGENARSCDDPPPDLCELWPGGSSPSSRGAPDDHIPQGPLPWYGWNDDLHWATP